jgi:Protein of unknown function (DUF3105)
MMINLARTVLALLAAFLLFAATQRTGADLDGAGAPSGHDVPIFASAAMHVHLGKTHPPYNSVPPTSGPHWPNTVATGVYREELPEEIQVTVLEFGHVLIQYAPQIPRTEIRELERIGRRHLRDVVVAPYEKLTPYARRGEGIALTAWGRLDRLGRAEEATIKSFIRAFSGRYEHGEWRDGAPARAIR